MLDGSTAGAVTNSKAVVYSSSGVVVGTKLQVADAGTIGSASFTGAIAISALGDVTIAAHDGGSLGLRLGSTLVTSTAAEINVLDGVTATTAELNYLGEWLCSAVWCGCCV